MLRASKDRRDHPPALPHGVLCRSVGTRGRRRHVAGIERNDGRHYPQPDSRCPPEVSSLPWPNPAWLEGSSILFLVLLVTREQDWNLRYRKDGGYFVTDRRINDPSGLIRSSASPSSSGPSPRAHPSPYSSSLRSTHLAGDATESTVHAEPAATAAEAAGPTGKSTTPVEAVPASSSQLPPATNGSDRPSTFASANTNGNNSDPALPSAPPAPTDMSFALQDSVLDGMSFNPTLNLGNSSASFLDPTGNPSGQSLPSFFGGVGDGAAAFDPFGFSGDGTPSMLPDSLFDWQSWRSFADSLGMPPQPQPPAPAPEPAAPEPFFQS